VRFGANLQAVFACALLWCLLVLALIDVAHFRLPNPVVGALAAIGLAGALVAQVSATSLVPLLAHGSTGALSHPVTASLTGALVGGGGALALAEGYALVRRRQGFGMGDVKLLGALGIWLGLYALMAFALASIVGTLYALGRALSTGEPLGQTRLPFGAFLAVGAATTVFVGSELLAAYLRAIGLL
jgi:leader peptidase (prepilin peptidase)/N-methyltransferase